MSSTGLSAETGAPARAGKKAQIIERVHLRATDAGQAREVEAQDRIAEKPAEHERSNFPTKQQ